MSHTSSKFDRVMTLCAELDPMDRTLYHYNGSALRLVTKLPKDENWYTVSAFDVERDCAINAPRAGTISVYRGIFAGEMLLDRKLQLQQTSPSSSEWFTSFAMQEGVLFATTSHNARVVFADLERSDSELVQLMAPLKLADEIHSEEQLICVDERLLLFSSVEDEQTWRVFQLHGSRKQPPTLVRTLPSPSAFAMQDLGPICCSSTVLAMVSTSSDREGVFTNVSFFDRNSLAPLFCIHTPMVTSLPGKPQPGSWYRHVDACEEQLLLCEQERGIAILSADALPSLARLAQRGIVAPEHVHAAATWIKQPNATVVEAYFCGPANVVATWQDRDSGEYFIALHRLET